MGSRSPTGELQVKGVAFRSVLKALEHLRGEDTVKRSLTLMDPEVADALTYATNVVSGWYPLHWYRNVFQGMLSATGEGDQLALAIGRQSVIQDLSGVYRLTVKLLSPQMLFSFSARTFHQYYSMGSLRILESRQGFVHVRYEDCAGFDRVLWMDVFGGAESCLSMAGAKHVRGRILTGGQDGQDFAEMAAHWSM